VKIEPPARIAASAANLDTRPQVGRARDRCRVRRESRATGRRRSLSGRVPDRTSSRVAP